MNHINLFQLTLKSNTKKVFFLGYRISLFDEKGNLIAAIESEGDKKYLSKNEVFDVFITRKTLGLHPGIYYISITVEDYELRKSTTNEKIIREDLIYKSFRLTVKNNNSTEFSPYVKLNI